MRLHLIIQRHGLPVTRVLWTTSAGPISNPTSAASSFTVSSSTLTSTRAPNACFALSTPAATAGSGGCTIAQLLEDVNEVIPLETQMEEDCQPGDGQWGLEDYTVEVNGFECLHFMEIDGLLRDGDEAVIRALQINDLMARRLTGRHQISADGKHLIDGVPFGRPYFRRSVTSRPPITIPPRKKRRLNFGGWEVARLPLNEAEDEDDDSDSDYQVDEEDEEMEEEDIREDSAGKELVLIEAQDDTEDVAESSIGRRRKRKSLPIDARHAQPLPNMDETKSHESIVRPPVDASADQVQPKEGTSPQQQLKTRKPLPETKSTSPKRTKSVSFEQLAASSSSDQSADDETSESASVSSSDADESSDSDESDSESLSDLSDSSDSDSSLTSSSSGSENSESVAASPEPITEVKIAQPIVNPPGKGSRRTKNSNRRAKLRRRLAKMKEAGVLSSEADFDDLRAWDQLNGNKYLPDTNDDSAASQDERADEQLEFEKKRERLLRDLESGGVDITPSSTNNNNHNEGAVADDLKETISDSLKRPAKLDIASSKRLISGSLGVNVPKTKEDEESTREKLASKGHVPKQAPKPTSTDEPAVNGDSYDIGFVEDWGEKINLQATECVYEDVKLTQPPFPFVQRWDREAQAVIKEFRGDQQPRGKKRKRKTRIPIDYHEEEYEESFNDLNGDDIQLDYGDDTMEITTNNNASASNSGDYSNDKSTCDLSKVDVHISSSDRSRSEESRDDLPKLPNDVSSLPDATESDLNVGAIVAFKQLDVSKATNWQPQVSQYLTAVVEQVLDDSTVVVRLVERDREPVRNETDEESGVRLYSKFEMPGYDDQDEDDGVRELRYDEMMEPKLLRSAVADSSVDIVEETQNVALPRISDNSGDEGNKTTIHIATFPIRKEVSQLMRDVGFRSEIDSGLSFPDNNNNIILNTDATPSPIANSDGENDEADSPIIKSPTFAGFPSSLHAEVTVSPTSDDLKPRKSRTLPASPAAAAEEPDSRGGPVSCGLGTDLVTESSPGANVATSKLPQASDNCLHYIDDSTALFEELLRDPPSRSSSALGTSPPFNQQNEPETSQLESLLSTIPPSVEENRQPDNRPTSRASSVVPNPFYEIDGGPDLTPTRHPVASTAPARTTAADKADSPPIRKKRKVLSSPRQRSTSPLINDSHDTKIGLSVGQEAELESSYRPGSSSQIPEGSYVVDLTVSSEPESPGNSDGDYATSQGLPRGPGWVRKRKSAARVRTRSAAGQSNNVEIEEAESDTQRSRRKGLRRSNI
ncbi:hypothetical protein AJ80_05889 [Polytolypa hystricis UAMH7299]|uniref:DUF7357 domain-containing protein n=1 Tax=Polytolypa hystricis (strain UAMH7299) TaxID=1447883 RepID=A0A2B7Y073_POLH7|nr:hypothetical protein AJ80_05889 [Polytolypa hystricis UAMH7299]